MISDKKNNDESWLQYNLRSSVPFSFLVGSKKLRIQRKIDKQSSRSPASNIHKSHKKRQPIHFIGFEFLKKLWCCVGGIDQTKNLVLSNELIKAELPP